MPSSEQSPIIGAGGKSALLKLARETLEAIATDSCETVLERSQENLESQPDCIECRPCFVTLSERNGELRGCIGRVKAEDPLYRNVFEMTQVAALHDPRFSPVEAAEVSNLVIEISVLGPMKPIENPSSIRLGSEGLYVKHRTHSGLLLAQVAVEHAWDVKTFIEQTCLKAHLDPKDFAEYEWASFEEIWFSE